MLNYAALKAADAALSPAIADPGAAATALNAQTVTLPAQDFPALAALDVLLVNGDWPKIVARSETRPIDANGPISAAISAVALLQGRAVVQASNASVWQTFTSMMTTLINAGDIGTASQNGIQSLRAPTVPTWPVILTANDVTYARSLP